MSTIKLRKVETYWGDRSEENCCEAPHILIKHGEYKCGNCGMVMGKEVVAQPRKIYKPEQKSSIQNEIVWREFGPRTMMGSMKKLHIYYQKKGIKRLSKIQRSLTNQSHRFPSKN